MRLLLHILLSGIFCIFAISCAKESSLPPEKLLEQAYEAAASNSWKRALDLAQMAEKIRPDDTSVLIMLSLAQENNGYEDDAFETIRKAAADEKSFMAQYTVGRMLYQRGRYEAAYLGAAPPETLTVHRKISISDFCAVVSREHPLAGEKSITPETLARYPLTVIDIFNDYNQYFIRRLKISAGHISKVNILEFPDYICLSGSVGVTIQSVFKRLKTENVVSIPVISKATEQIGIEVSLVTAKGAVLSPEVEAFIENEIDADKDKEQDNLNND